MGYNTYVTGVLKISPPLVGDQIETVPLDADYLGWFLAWDIERREIEAVVTVEGQTITTTTHVRVAVGLAETGNGPGKAYKLVEQVRELVTALVEKGRTVNGSLRMTGADPGDVWRIVVLDKGRLIADGSFAQIEHSENEIARHLVTE